MSHLLTRLRAKRGEEGFTLVELLVVVVIIGILIAIAIPVYLNYTKSAKDKSAQSDVRNAISVLETCYSDNSNQYPASATWASDTTICGSQKITVSNGTTLTYTAASGNASYILTGTNSGGVPKYYCYNSSNGGAVKQFTSAVTTC